MEEQSTSGFKFTKKTIIGLVVLVLLVAAIPIGVYLSQQKTIFKPKASEIKTSSEIGVTPETSLTLFAPTSVEPGKQISVSVAVRSDIDAANLFAVKLKFPTDLLEIVAYKVDNFSDGSSGFIKNWVENTFDKQAGTISLVGGIPDPGYKTTLNQPSEQIVEITFKAKKAGSATVSFDAGSAIYRNSDNVDILDIKRNVDFKIETPAVTTAPTPTSSASNQNLIVNGDFSQGETGWNFINYSSANHKIENGTLVLKSTRSTTGSVYQRLTLSPNQSYHFVVTSWSASFVDQQQPVKVCLVSNNSDNLGKCFKFNSTSPETQELIYITPSATPSGGNMYTIIIDTALTITPVDVDTFIDNIGLFKVSADVTLPPPSPTPTSTPVGIKGDINGDGKVDLVDMSILLSKMGKKGAEVGKADINGDGVVNTFDYSLLIQILIQNGVIKKDCGGLPRC